MDRKASRKHGLRIARAALALGVLCAAVGPRPLHAGEKYTFTAFTYSRFGDANRIDMIEALEIVGAIASEALGAAFEYVDYSSVGHYKGLVDGKVDIGLVSMEDVFLARRDGVELDLVGLVSLKKQSAMRACVYATRPLKDIKELAGASVNLYGGGIYRGAYHIARKLLADHGIDAPLRGFFGPIYKIPYEGSAFQAMLLGRIDAVIDADWSYEMFGKSLPGAESIKSYFCSEEYPVIGVFMQKGLFDKESVDKLRTQLKALDRNPRLGKFRTIFLMFDIKFVDPDPELLDRAYKLFDHGLEQGWFDEAEEFSARMDELEFGQSLAPEKLSYGQCKTLCEGAEDREGCMDRCMGE